MKRTWRAKTAPRPPRRWPASAADHHYYCPPPPAGPSEGGARSKEGPAGGGGYYYHYEEGLAIVLCIVIAQKALFRHWITPTVKDEIHQIYFMACCGALALCSIKYGPMEGALLIAKFSLHWLAHICRGVAILNNNNNGNGGRP